MLIQWLAWLAGIPVWMLTVAVAPLARIRPRERTSPRLPRTVSVRELGNHRFRVPTVITGFPAAPQERVPASELVRDRTSALLEAYPGPTELPATFGGGYWGLKLKYSSLPTAEAIGRVFRREHGVARVLADPAEPLPPEVFVPEGWTAPLLWFQSKGNVTPFHYDLREGLLVQVTGRKRVLFSSPVKGLHHLRPFSAYSSPRNFYVTRAGLDGDDYYAAVESAVVYETIIGPGECVYIPSFWWHHVECLDDCVSVTLMRPARSSSSHFLLGPRMVWAKLYELRTRASSWRPAGNNEAFDIDAAEFYRALKRAGGDIRSFARALHISDERAAEHMRACESALPNEATLGGDMIEK
jgi:Cupin-like domain